LAREIVAHKSYQTIVGSAPANGAEPEGVYILDTNDTANFYGLFVIYNGDRARAQFAVEHLRRRFSAYCDVFQNRDIAKPRVFFQELLTDMLREMQKNGMEPADGDSMAAVLLKEGRAIIGRLRNCPIFYLRDHKYRNVFPSSGSGSGKLEVTSVTVSNNDMILLCSQDMVRRITKQELRSLILSKSDPDEACARITELANRYEEVKAPRIVLISLKRNREESKALLNTRNIGLLAGIALLILGLVFWREISGFVQHSLKSRIVSKIQNMSESLGGGGDKRGGAESPMYEFETLFDGLAVPYDIAVSRDEVYFVVDDKESQIIRFDPSDKKMTLVGNGLDLQFPTGIEIIGNNLYVTDFKSTANQVLIIKADGTVGKTIKAVDKPGVGSLRNPKAIAADEDSNIWVADRTNNRILKFNMHGDYIGKVQCSAAFSSPNGLASGPEGRIFATFKDTNNVAVIEKNGALKEFKIHSGEGENARPVAFDQPSGIAVDRKGFVYVADRQNNRIVVSDPRGRVDAILDKTRNSDFATYMPFGLKLGPKGKYLYIVGSAALSYDSTCQFEADKCRGKIWRMRIE